MDVYSSGEELLVKARKPYTITKQRERWTEEEHTKFLEALKLHGRAWQRIEEHIGTKTAVQIRSHAQKFFSKLEKEALVKGVPIGQAIDIEIPPPRPKRKPSNPYPRKTGSVCSPNTQVRAKDENHIHYAKQVVDLEKEPQSEEHVGDDGEKNLKGTCVGDECSGSFTLFQEMPSVVGPTESSATVTGVVRKLSNLKEFVPVKKTSNTDERSESHAGEGPNLIYRPNKPDPVEKAQNDSKNEMHAAKSFPRHAPVQILDGSQGTCSQGFSSDVSFQEPRVQMKISSHPALYSNPATSGIVGSHISTTRSSNQQMYPGFHPLPSPFPNNHEDYSSYLQMSSTFSSLILSALLQNPAAHAAASFAASLWPSTNVETSANSSVGNNGGFPGRAVHPAPSMAAIAAATVAAATAWWAAHGLLPLSAPLPTGFPIPPGSVAALFANVGQTSAANDEKEGNNSQVPGSEVQQPEQVPSEALRPQHSASKSSATSSSDSGNSGDKMDIGVSPTNEVAPSISDQKDISKVKNKKQADRSSCGSNTASGSDVETDALEKNVEGNEETKEPDENNNGSENGRRMRIVGNNPNDSWKEVSEEGRLAFRALFSRGRLPQSFSPPQDVTCKGLDMNCGVEDQRQIAGQSNEALRLDLNSNTWESVSCDQGIGNFGSQCQGNVNSKDGLLTIGLLQTKLTSNRTGFKPYKRCSVEATDNRMMNSSNQEQGNCSKRLRLEGEASI